MAFFYNPASCVHKHRVPCHVKWGWRDTRQFWSKTYRNRHHTPNCESVQLIYHFRYVQSCKIARSHSSADYLDRKYRIWSCICQVSTAVLLCYVLIRTFHCRDTSNSFLYIHIDLQNKNCLSFFDLYCCDRRDSVCGCAADLFSRVDS